MKVQPNDNDDETFLLKRIAQEDQSALAELYDRYARVIYSLAFQILGSVEEAEEVVLDVFSQVWRTASRYNSQRGRVDSWLFLLARSRSLDRLRALKRQTRSTTASIAAGLHTDTTASPEENLLLFECHTRIQQALRQLPAAQRQSIECAYYKGMTHTEIAAATGKSPGTIKTRIRLGLTKLRQIIDTP